MTTVSPASEFVLRRTVIGGERLDDDYEVFGGKRSVGRIMCHPQAPKDAPWFWTITARLPQTTADRGYAATREEAMMALKVRWCEV
jgi:hypothetical protein